ncbi:orotidine-5'-phosphate decarboxylase [Galbitalea sp. SE-J8]|uniref:orotidine-5'-phosphate decarboxylase n=1 Tax=Galbitalea sp. SE-J8 TaxID=3054952 RepID=UPI00259CD011|nr:orotidine-5'-phosphate decarboxylase [Galbitalea sp. SE-J8]MDM4764030.1 orotidine-5'-phosphate decarboxylase [Galbitalea sp. SE-J8]
MTFGERLSAAFSAHGQLCAGIDPHAFLLEEWGLTDDAAGVREFGLRVVEGAAGLVGVVKPQVAFFERHGAAGIAALEHVLAAARAAGLLVIADAKRGDLGTSVEAYGQAWLTPGSPLEADALTVAAYMGTGSLHPVRALATEHGKGLFLLAATSNPEAAALQRAVRADGATVAAGIVADVHAWNAESRRAAAPAALGPFGVVVGATVALADYAIADTELVGTPVLAPGFGHQGARFRDATALFGAATGGVAISSSRGVLSAGPDRFRAALAQQADEVREACAA